MDFELALEGELLEELGRRIRVLRKAQGWTQQRLADQMGVSRRTVLEMEQGGNIGLNHWIRAWRAMGRMGALDEMTDASAEAKFSRLFPER